MMIRRLGQHVATRNWANPMRFRWAAFSSASAESTERETRMRTLLTDQLKPTRLVIQDVSGGCGAMYSMEIDSPLFAGKSLVAQHRLVNQILAKEIAEMHGLSLKTKPSKST